MKRDDLPDYDEHERWLEEEPDNRNPDTARAEVRARRVADARSRLIGELHSGEPSPRQPALDAVATRQAVPPETSNTRPRGGLSAFLYARVSTREQARTGGGEEGYSIPAQREACMDKARQLDAAVTGVYVDAGVGWEAGAVVAHYSVSSFPPSNRACGSPAHGFPTSFTVRHAQSGSSEPFR